jgi:hypothetical protein
VWLSVSVHPFDCIVDTDRNSFVDRVGVRARREFCLELGEVEAGGLDVGPLSNVNRRDPGSSTGIREIH